MTMKKDRVEQTCLISSLICSIFNPSFVIVWSCFSDIHLKNKMKTKQTNKPLISSRSKSMSSVVISNSPKSTRVSSCCCSAVPLLNQFHYWHHLHLHSLMPTFLHQLLVAYMMSFDLDDFESVLQNCSSILFLRLSQFALSIFLFHW